MVVDKNIRRLLDKAATEVFVRSCIQGGADVVPIVLRSVRNIKELTRTDATWGLPRVQRSHALDETYIKPHFAHLSMAILAAGFMVYWRSPSVLKNRRDKETNAVNSPPAS